MDPQYQLIVAATDPRVDARAIWLYREQPDLRRMLNPVERRGWALRNFATCRALSRAFCKDWAFGERLAVGQPTLLVDAAKWYAAERIGRAAEVFDVPDVQTIAAQVHDAKLRAEYADWFGLRENFEAANVASFVPARPRDARAQQRCALFRRPLSRPQNRRRGAGRPRASAVRSSARSGDSGDDPPGSSAASARCSACGGILLWQGGTLACANRSCPRWGCPA
jgi:hypothetical protein